MSAFVAADRSIHHPVTHRGSSIVTGVVQFDAEEGTDGCLGDEDMGDVENDEKTEQDTLGNVSGRFGRFVGGNGPENGEECDDDDRDRHEEDNSHDGTRYTGAG